ncbi:nuclear transport factor 2 family protein [Ilumatobacter nonamiensis]|uniref:nuclear transport factor 2 family protein n=1 Tax=Ilumatobacter nonamiensis TaxID=467093 RepID=UPI00034A7C2B|nr:nuclear transport factor 2 family protein [Ilumatobacter nonamiensis]
MSAGNHDDLSTALDYVAALGGADPDLVAALVSDDFRNEHHAELGSGCVGRDEYARRLPDFFANFPNRRYDVTETAIGELLGDSQGGSEVVVRYRFGADVEGTRIDIPGVMWISVRDGLVSRRLDCWDSLTFYRQTGLPPG